MACTPDTVSWALLITSQCQADAADVQTEEPVQQSDFEVPDYIELAFMSDQIWFYARRSS